MLRSRQKLIIWLGWLGGGFAVLQGIGLFLQSLIKFVAFQDSFEAFIVWTIPCFFISAFGLLGLIGSLEVEKNPIRSGSLQLVAGIVGFIPAQIFLWLIPGPLLIVGGVLALSAPKYSLKIQSETRQPLSALAKAALIFGFIGSAISIIFGVYLYVAMLLANLFPDENHENHSPVAYYIIIFFGAIFLIIAMGLGGSLLALRRTIWASILLLAPGIFLSCIVLSYFWSETRAPISEWDASSYFWSLAIIITGTAYLLGGLLALLSWFLQFRRVRNVRI